MNERAMSVPETVLRNRVARPLLSEIVEELAAESTNCSLERI